MKCIVLYLSLSKKRVCILFKYFENSMKKIKSQSLRRLKINKRGGGGVVIKSGRGVLIRSRGGGGGQKKEEEK